MREVARADPRTQGETLGFAFLVYSQHKDVPIVWTARSVLTGHVAHGATEDAAIKSLQQVIDVSIFMAQENGQPPREWMAAQRRDQDKYIYEFCMSVAAQGVENTEKTRLAKSGCVLEMRISRRVA